MSVFCLCFLLSFIVSGLTFESLIHFKIIFVCGVKECSNFILLSVAAQLSPGEGNGPHSSTLAWKIPWTEWPMELLRVRHDWATSLSLSLSCIGEENDNPLQCSCLENPRDGGAWWAAVYGVAQSQTGLKWLSSSSSPAFPAPPVEEIVFSSLYILASFVID